MLLDVGGVLLLPAHDRLLGALGRAGFTPPVEVLDRAHYAGAARLDSTTVDTEWPHYWKHYLDGFLTACEIPDELREEAHEHLVERARVRGSGAASRPDRPKVCARSSPPASGSASCRTRTGPSNASCATRGIAQVGPGDGVEVECIIDSTAVGRREARPADLRVRARRMGVAAEDAWYVGDTPAFDVDGARNAGLRPLLLDPYEFHLDGDCDRVGTLDEVAALIPD